MAVAFALLEFRLRELHLLELLLLPHELRLLLLQNALLLCILLLVLY